MEATTHRCPRCQYPDAPTNRGSTLKGYCSLCDGTGRVEWLGGSVATAHGRTCGGSLTHVEMQRLESPPVGSQGAKEDPA